MEENKNNAKNNWLPYIINFFFLIGAFLLGRLFGLLGVGAVAVGWYAYTHFEKKFGLFMGIIIGATIGLAVYGLAAAGLSLMTS